MVDRTSVVRERMPWPLYAKKQGSRMIMTLCTASVVMREWHILCVMKSRDRGSDAGLGFGYRGSGT